MAENDSEKRIVISIDKAASDNALKSIKALDSASQKLNTSLKSAGKGANDYASQLRLAIREDNAAAKAANELSDAFREQTKEADKTLSVIDRLKQGYSDLKASSSGGLGGQVSDIRGSLSAFGGGSPVLGAVGGLSDAVEAFGTLNPIALTAAASIGALSLVTAGYTQAADKQAQALTSLIDAQRAVNQQTAQGLTTEDAQARLDELEQLRADEQALLDENTRILAEASLEILDKGTLIALGIAQITGPLPALNAEIATSGELISSYDAEIAALNAEIESGSLAANDTEQAELELAQTREQEAQRAIAEAEAANARIASLEQQRISMLDSRLIAEQNANEVERLNARFAREDEKAQLIEHRNKLKSIQADGNARLEALELEAQKLPQEQAKKSQEIQAKGNKQLEKLNAEYFKNQIKSFDEFATESGRIADDTAKAAKRLADDISDNLADAARDNDVIAFLKIQRDGQKELKQNAEDATEAEKRRVVDFNKQQDEQREAFLERSKEIMEQIATEKAENAKAFAEKKKALDEQHRQEVANIQNAISAEKARYRQQEEREAQAASRQAQRDSLRASQEEVAFNRQLNAIDRKVQAELDGLARIQNAALQLGGKYGVNPASTGYGNSFSGKGGFSSMDKGRASPNIIINNTVGDIVTGQQVSNAIAQSADMIKQGFVGALNKAQGGR